MKQLSICILVLLSGIASSCQSNSLQLSSPDKRTQIEFFINSEGCPYYSVSKEGQDILLASPLGVILEQADLSHDLRIVSTHCSSFDETWEQVWGEEVSVRNHYNELRIELQHTISHLPLNIVFRAFDDGVAFRYEFPANDMAQDFRILDETTSYCFADSVAVWSIPWRAEYYESLWSKHKLNILSDTVSSPVTIAFSNGTYGCLHEANLTDYAAQNFYVTDNQLHTYLTPWSDGTKVYGMWGKTQSPWRFLTLADNLNALVNSRIMLNLNEPCKIEDTSWIRPMKYIGIWWGMHMESFTWHQGPLHGATTENMCRYIDFAAKHNIPGVLAEGWNYGWDGDWTKNGDIFSFTRPYPDYDIAYLSEYARQNGVHIIGHHETGGNTINYEQQLDSAFRFLNQYGISDVKTGYVKPLLDDKEYHKSQYGVRHYRKVIETAAKYRITIDNHEPVMPTGLQRTYPNLMTQEGVRGAEYDAWCTDGGSPAEHMCVLPFTRGLAGPIDFTFGTFNFTNPVYPQTRVHSTLAKQLALYVVIYSPLQMASDLPENYEGKPAFRFIEQVPVDWQQTIILDATIGDYVITARKDKHSDDWYVGAITDENERDIDIPLSFLTPNTPYQIDIYRDGEHANWETNPYPIVIEQDTLTSHDHYSVRLGAGGGCALRLTPLKQ